MPNMEYIMVRKCQLPKEDQEDMVDVLKSRFVGAEIDLFEIFLIFACYYPCYRLKDVRYQILGDGNLDFWYIGDFSTKYRIHLSEENLVTDVQICN